MSGSQDTETCVYTAEKGDPSNWHGDEPDDWVLDDEAPLGLEQEGWTCPHDALDNSEHCAFHTDPDDVPDEIDEGELFIEAINEASSVDDEKRARRKKEFVGATFGAFDIEDATLDADDENPIRLDHATFAEGIHANGAVFKHCMLATRACFETGDVRLARDIRGILFDSAEFRGDGGVSFMYAEFSGDGGVSFDSAEFRGDGNVSFMYAEFSVDGEVSFDSAEFRGDGNVSFMYTEFSVDGGVSFDSAEFGGDGEVLFMYVEFGGDGGVSFDSAEFGVDGRVSFDSAEFGVDGRVSFDSAKFGGGGRVSFVSAEFGGDGNVSFRYAKFGGDGEVLFKGAEFGGDGEVLFKGAEFSGDGMVSFVSAEFGGDGMVSFVSAEFRGDGEVLFKGAEFGGDGNVTFSYGQFSVDGNVSFRGAEFGVDGDVLFRGTEFDVNGNVSFKNAMFGVNGNVSFTNAMFGVNGNVTFSHGQFSVDGNVSFRGVEFGGDGDVSFERVTIISSLSFVNTRFHIESTAVFSDVEFHNSVRFGSSHDDAFQHSLDFSNATFHRAPDFRGATDSTRKNKTADSGETQFDLVFTGDVEFTGTVFKNGVDFSTTRFPSNVDFTDAKLESADFSGADVTGTADVSEASFDGANMTGANLSNTTLTGASFERARLSRAELLGADLTGTKLYGALLGDVRINRETSFWLDGSAERREQASGRLPIRAIWGVKNTLRRQQDPYCAYDPRYRGPEGEPDIEKSLELYGTLETLARQNSLSRLASECFLGRKDVQLRQYWRDSETWMVIRSVVPNVVARYGESAGRVLGSGAFVIAVCGFSYYAFDLIERADSGSPVTLFESLYFSALTFTTLGYGDFTPSNSVGQLLAVAETSLGVILLAILVFVFGRRATR